MTRPSRVAFHGGLAAMALVVGCVAGRPAPCEGARGEVRATAKPSRPAASASSRASGEKPFFRSEPMPTHGGAPYNHAATIAETPSGDLLAAWGCGAKELGRDTAIVSSRRHASGGSWSEATVVADKPGRADANPALFAADGVVHLLHVEMFGDTFCLGRVVGQTSADDGRTWTAATPVLPAICTMVKNKPIVTRAGRWIVPGYNEAVYQSQFWYSDDQGGSWRCAAPPVKLLDHHLQPSVVELGDGSLLALMRNGGRGHFTWEGRSRDGGATWSLRPRRELPNPNSGIDMARLTDGTIVLVYNDSPTERTPLVAAASRDEGESWGPARVIDGSAAPLAYPAVIATRDGRIHVVYSRRMTHIEHAEFNVAWVMDPRGDAR